MKPFRRASFYVACVSLVLSLPAFAADPTSGKKLIEFGWDEPDPAFMRAHLAEMEPTPFDGCVFHADATTPEASSTGWAGPVVLSSSESSL